jgi:DNA (cytosine-5)-methyltransferase 1
LAGYEHLGGVEIDPKVAEVYRLNHNSKYLFVQDIREFNNREDLPPELYSLDLLDGSPPCSSFSMAGNREKDWGKKKQFREGQEFQRLDDLVFEYVRTIEKLQPKVALLENVKGLITGNAKVYAKNLKAAFEAAGYRVQVFLLNAASMGVPQKRERVFFIGQRKDLVLPELRLSFNERPIIFGQIRDDKRERSAMPLYVKYWNESKEGDILGKSIADFRMKSAGVPNTIKSGGHFLDSKTPTLLNSNEVKQIGSFPFDYNFNGTNIQYLIGMSVPPVMTAQIAHQIYIQWLSKIKKK